MPRGRPRKVLSGQPLPISTDTEVVEVELVVPVVETLVPTDWRQGALLNVRNAGDAYLITLWPEEYDHRKPERTLRFTNPGEAQNFVSAWYSRQHADPRAMR